MIASPSSSWSSCQSPLKKKQIACLESEQHGFQNQYHNSCQFNVLYAYLVLCPSQDSYIRIQRKRFLPRNAAWANTYLVSTWLWSRGHEANKTHFGWRLNIAIIGSDTHPPGELNTQIAVEHWAFCAIQPFVQSRKTQVSNKHPTGTTPRASPMQSKCSRKDRSPLLWPEAQQPIH